jgi:PBSX family phage terminase large subunit
MTTGQELKPVELRGASRLLWTGVEPELVVHGPADCGKSFMIGLYLYSLCETWPGLRLLVARLTRVSLSKSFINTFERLILPPSHPINQKRVSPSHRESYRFPNGSEIWMCGLDNPTSLYSSEFDIVFVEECNEITEDEWERFFRAIRYKTIPHPHGPDPETGEPRYLNRIIGACNPDSERHWILNRAKKKGPDGKPLLTLIQASHSDNPTFTRQSQERLDRLSGVRRKRLRDGIWCSAEGAIWENYDRSKHVVADHPRDANGKLAYAWTVVGVDFGFTHAANMTVYGVDYDGRMYRAWEWMREGCTIGKMIERAVLLNKQWNPVAFVCDSADPGKIHEMRAAGLPAQPVVKSGDGKRDFVELTLDLVRDRLDVQPDGMPRLMFVADQMDDPDPNMVEAGKPTCIEDEIPGYVLKRDAKSGRVLEGVPADNQDDHSCFPAGTLVVMGDGVSQRSIEDIIVGDSVWTPHGPELGIEARQTGYGETLVIEHEHGWLECTEDHPIYVDGVGMVPACDVVPGTILRCVSNALSSTACGGTGIQTPATAGVSTTAHGLRVGGRAVASLHASSFTATSGRRPTALSREECTSTTGTATRPTTGWKTLRWSRRPSMGFTTASTKAGYSPSVSDKQPPDAALASASAVGLCSCQPSRDSTSSAHSRAKQQTDAAEELTTSHASAFGATASLSSESTPIASTVAARVLRVRMGPHKWPVPVYNLTVEPSHVYFANGVLVGNCAALRYSVAYVERYHQTGARGDSPPPRNPELPARMSDFMPPATELRAHLDDEEED